MTMPDHHADDELVIVRDPDLVYAQALGALPYVLERASVDPAFRAHVLAELEALEP